VSEMYEMLEHLHEGGLNYATADEVDELFQVESPDIMDDDEVEEGDEATVYEDVDAGEVEEEEGYDGGEEGHVSEVESLDEMEGVEVEEVGTGHLQAANLAHEAEEDVENEYPSPSEDGEFDVNSLDAGT